MTKLLHGINVTEINEGINTVRTSSSSVIGVIGTAPDASAEDFPVNTPVLIAGSMSDAAKLGSSGTLPTALNGILAQTGAMVVVVRIEEGEDDETTQLNIIGEAKSDGTYTGVHAFLSAKSKLGVAPRILIAPELCSKEVVAEMITIANRLRAIIVADIPDDTNDNLIDFVTTCSSDRVYAVYPKVINTKNETVAASSFIAGVIAKSDNENGFWVSPSNKVINGIVGLSKPVDFSLGDSSCRANYLNENGITTIINQNGYRVWGNRSTANEGAYKFLCVRRTA